MRLYLIMPFALIILLGCNKIKVEKPSLNVITDKLTYHVGDSVKFNLSGYADYIYFYSGENGSDYSMAGLSEKISSIETGAIPEQFIHIYNSPGIYNAVIVARNATVDNHEEVVTKFNITVEP